MVSAATIPKLSSKSTMVKKGSTTTRRGRKPQGSVSQDSSSSSSKLTDDSASIHQTTPKKEVVAHKTKASFKGTLSHASPILDGNNEKKITIYFSKAKPEQDLNIKEDKIEEEVGQVAKSLALQRVFGKTISISEQASTDVSPHKIVLEEEHQVAEVLEESEKCSKDEIPTEQSVKEPKAKAMKSKRKLNVNQSLNQESTQNHKLTEYFAVRRSVRKPKTAILEEKQRNLEESVLSGKEEGLEIHTFPGKGRGIVANRLFRRGEFVVEYSGDLIELTEARQREKVYAADQNTGCYMYYFQHKNQSYCVDATAESERLGRLVNHSRSAGNLVPKIIEIKDRPHLLLVARSDILPGEELLYDYGDRSRDSLKHHPWLAS